MTRKITIAGRKVEVSKNEAKEAARIAELMTEARQKMFNSWLLNTTPEAKARRVNVGKALGLKVPE